MNFKTIPDIEAARAEFLHQRLNQLELEYLSNEAALVAADALPDGDTKETEKQRLRDNLALLDSVHGHVAAEHEKRKPKPAPPAPPAPTPPAPPAPPAPNDPKKP